MTTHDPDGLPPELAPFARDGARHLDGLVAQARPAPDFAAMLARARELAPDLVAADTVAQAEALPPVIPLARPEPRSDAGALAPFTAALRAELDSKLAERRMASIPPPPLPRRRRAGVVVGLAAALAAAVLLALLGPDLVARRAGDRGVAANAEGGAGRVDEARAGVAGELHVELATPPSAAGHVHGDMSAATGSSAADAPEDMLQTPGSAAAAADAAKDPPRSPGDPAPAVSVPKDMLEATGVETTDPEPRPRKPAAKDGPRRRPPAAAAPAAPAGPSLEDEAQLLWQKGELAAAERKYRQILDLAGASLRAELAYGDLFALARQIRGGEGQAAVWREYLDRFPDGRFADDARAGLCRRGTSDARAACWRDYLDHHPTGAHRKQAEAALADAGAAEAP